MGRFEKQPHESGERSLAAPHEKREAEEGGRMKKERVAKDDGRYIIFFSFEDDEDLGEDS